MSGMGSTDTMIGGDVHNRLDRHTTSELAAGALTNTGGLERCEPGGTQMIAACQKESWSAGAARLSVVRRRATERAGAARQPLDRRTVTERAGAQYSTDSLRLCEPGGAHMFAVCRRRGEPAGAAHTDIASHNRHERAGAQQTTAGRKRYESGVPIMRLIAIHPMRRRRCTKLRGSQHGDCSPAVSR